MTLKIMSISNNNNNNLPFILSLPLFLEGTVFFPPSRTPSTKKGLSHSLSLGLSMNDQYNLHFHLTACSQDASTQPHISTSVTYAQPPSHLPQSPGATWMCVCSTEHEVYINCMRPQYQPQVTTHTHTHTHTPINK